MLSAFMMVSVDDLRCLKNVMTQFNIKRVRLPENLQRGNDNKP